MNKKLTIWLGIASLVLGVIVHFNKPTVGAFLLFSFGFAIVLFSLILYYPFIIKLIDKKKYLKLVPAILLFMLLIFLLFFLLSNSVRCSAMSFPHFRTNILTGSCSFIGYGSCSNNYWYYKNGCNSLMVDEKIVVLQASSDYLVGIDFCSSIRDSCVPIELCDFSELYSEVPFCLLLLPD